MRRLAEQHDARTADALEERLEPRVGDAAEGLRRLGDELRQAGGGASHAPCARRFFLPALLADERHETHGQQVFLLVLLLASAPDAHQALLARRVADRHHEAPADGKLLAQRHRHLRPAGGYDDCVVRRGGRQAVPVGTVGTGNHRQPIRLEAL